MKTKKEEVSVQELLAKIAELEAMQEKQENALFEKDFLLQQERVKNEKKELLLSCNHANVAKKEDLSFSVKDTNRYDIVRKCVKKRMTFDEIANVLMQSYSVSVDRSKTQKALKQQDLLAYSKQRAKMYLTNVLKEVAIIDFLKERLTVKQYAEKFVR